MSEHSPGSPITCPSQQVIEDWIDYNGHLNMAYYNVVFDRGVDFVFDYLGVGEAYAQSGKGSVFSMEVHLHYLQELSLGDELELHFQLLDYDHKRLHFIEMLYHKQERYLAATSEQISMHVNMQTRRSAPFDAEVIEKLEQIHQAHQHLDVPTQVGHVIGIKKKS